MQSSKGLSNMTHQPLLESLMRSHNNKHIVYVRKSNRIPHPHFFRIADIKSQTFKYIPHTKHTIANLVAWKIPSDLHHSPIIDSHT